MKSILKSLAWVTLLSQIVLAQFVNVQGVIRDNDSNTVPDGQYTIIFKLYSSESGGSASWTETQTLTVTNGVYGAALGTESSLTGLSWDTQFWLEIASISGSNFSTSEALSPRTLMTMTPYAILAGMSGTTNVVPQDGNVGIGTTSPGFKLDVQGNSAVARLGRAFVGGWPANSDYAFFGNQNLNHASAGNYGLLQAADGTTFLNAASGKNILIRINNSNKMIIASNGNVGIGTSSPTDKLHVQGDIRMAAGKTFKSEGRMHIDGEELLYLLHNDGVIVSKAWGGNGDLTVEGNLKVGPFYFDGNDDSWLRLRNGDNGSYKDLAVGNLYSSGNLTANNNTPDGCAWTGWQNSWDAEFATTCPSGKFMQGLGAYHSNSREDRRFRYYCCEL